MKTNGNLIVSSINEIPHLPDSLMDGLVLWYPFIEKIGDTVHDYSGNGNDGTLNNFSDTSHCAGDTGDSGWLADGGLKFDGTDDYVNCGDLSSIEGINEITINIRCKLNDVSSAMSLIGKGGYYDADGSFAIQYRDDSDRDRISFSIGNHSYTYCVSGIADDFNEYYMITAVYSATSEKIDVYVNGENMPSSSEGGTFEQIPSSSHDLKIGMINFATNGIISHTQIYNRALSADEVTYLYRMGL